VGRFVSVSRVGDDVRGEGEGEEGARWRKARVESECQIQIHVCTRALPRCRLLLM
jgi:hypothetical protein